MTEPPEGLAEQGLEFWNAVVAAKGVMSPGEYALLGTACRLLDRMERADWLLRGGVEDWAQIIHRDGEPSVLVVSSLVSESRQMIAEFRQVVKAIGIPAPKAAAAGGLAALRKASDAG